MKCGGPHSLEEGKRKECLFGMKMASSRQCGNALMSAEEFAIKEEEETSAAVSH